MKSSSSTIKRTSRALALILSLMLLLTMTTVPAFAADSAAATDPSLFDYSDNGDGTIYIESYNGDDKDTMTELVIPEEIDGESVTVIGWNAFEGCTSLTSVTIPESMTEIEQYAFFDCPNLKAVTIPKSVASIEDHAFGYCNGRLDENYDYICDKVEGFEITGYTNSAAHKYAVDNGFEFVSLGEVSPFAYEELGNGTIEITGYNGAAAQIDIPAKMDGKKVVGIGAVAFYGCANLTSVTIPDSVVYINTSAFYNCPNLKAVTIPKSVVNIEWSAFGYYEDEETLDDLKVEGFKITGYKNSAAYAYACDNEFDFTSLGEVDPLAYEELEDGTLKLIAYYGDKKELTKLDIPAEVDGKSVTEIEYGAFFDCTSLTSVTIPEGVNSIGDTAFYNCPNLKAVTIPKSVTYIDYEAFGYYADGETWEDLKVEGFTITGYKNSAAYAYARSNDFEFVSLGETDNTFYGISLDDGTISITGCYTDRDELTDVSIPEKLGGKSVTGIMYDTFKGCASLKSVSTPSSLKSIEYNSFADCESLENVNLSSGLTTIGDNAFYNCPSLKEITIPASVTEIGECAFGFIDDNTKVEGFTIKSYAGTAAEDYANDNGFEFIALEKKSGDIDGSGAVDAKDRMTITRYIAKWKGYESIDKTAADVNSDGEVDAADRMIITRHIAKWKGYETLPYTS